MATILSSFISGMLAAMGLGGGTVLIVYLTYFRYFAQTEAQGINLFCFIPIALLSVIIYTKKGLMDKKVIIPVVFYGIFGAGAGFVLLQFLPTHILSKIFGAFLIALSLKELFAKKKD